MKGVEQQQDDAAADDEADEEGVAALAQIDALHQAVDQGEAVGKVVQPRLQPLEGDALRHQVVSCLHGDRDLLVQQTVRAEKLQ